jgi:hypothetical protein
VQAGTIRAHAAYLEAKRLVDEEDAERERREAEEEADRAAAIANQRLDLDAKATRLNEMRLYAPDLYDLARETDDADEHHIQYDERVKGARGWVGTLLPNRLDALDNAADQAMRAFDVPTLVLAAAHQTPLDTVQVDLVLSRARDAIDAMAAAITDYSERTTR